MERKAWKSYREVSRHPNKKRKLGTVESALHSICCADNISWKEAFRRLIHSSAQQGTMPQGRHTVCQENFPKFYFLHLTLTILY